MTCIDFQMVLEQVCRLARVISSPHDTAHCVLVAEGCPGRASTIAKLAAHLANFIVYRITPSPIATPHKYDLESFKADLVTGYTRAGVKVSLINGFCSFTGLERVYVMERNLKSKNNRISLQKLGHFTHIFINFWSSIIFDHPFENFWTLPCFIAALCD